MKVAHMCTGTATVFGAADGQKCRTLSVLQINSLAVLMEFFNV